MSLNGGYAMIKYNSTQEELQIAYRSKKPALFYDENQIAHWAVIEETATESVDEETQEPITLYKYSYRLLDEASEVVANPTLSGDEATLDGLEVDGTKYKVGGGSEVHLYRHIIQLGGTAKGSFIIENDNSTPFTISSVIDFLVSNGFTTYNETYPFTGIGGTTGTNRWYCVGLYSISGSAVMWSINTFGGNTIEFSKIEKDIITRVL